MYRINIVTVNGVELGVPLTSTTEFLDRSSVIDGVMTLLAAFNLPKERIASVVKRLNPNHVIPSVEVVEDKEGEDIFAIRGVLILISDEETHDFALMEFTRAWEMVREKYDF